jgi:hypothetical protein
MSEAGKSDGPGRESGTVHEHVRKMLMKLKAWMDALPPDHQNSMRTQPDPDENHS